MRFQIRSSETRPGKVIVDTVPYDVALYKPMFSTILSKVAQAAAGWRRVTFDDLDGIDAVNVQVDVNTGGGSALRISTLPLNSGCGSPGSADVIMIKGTWTKIRFTEEFWGRTSCYGIFGNEVNRHIATLSLPPPFFSLPFPKITTSYTCARTDTHANTNHSPTACTQIIIIIAIEASCTLHITCRIAGVSPPKPERQRCHDD